MEDLYQQKGSKTRDFIIGFFINIGIAAATFASYFMFYALGMTNSKGTTIAVISMGILFMFLLQFYLIRKYLRERRYIAIGLISAIVFPLLVVGTCSPLFYSMLAN